LAFSRKDAEYRQERKAQPRALCGTLRLCAKYLSQIIDYAMNPVFDKRDIKVDKQTEPKVFEPNVG
jgi:hypothetical protein